MIRRLWYFFAELERHKAPPVPEQIDRSPFLQASDPLEVRLAEALRAFPPEELRLLILSFGLDGSNPQPPLAIAQSLHMMLPLVLDTGTGAVLRLRNRTLTRALVEAIAGQEAGLLARHRSRPSSWCKFPDGLRA